VTYLRTVNTRMLEIDLGPCVHVTLGYVSSYAVECLRLTTT